MTQTAHTPGPWRLSPHYKVGFNGVSKGPTPNRYTGIYIPIPGQELGSSGSVLTVGLKGAEVDDYWLNLSDANARLIAAAPDMLEALMSARAKLAVHRPHDLYPDGSVIPGPSEILRTIDAAITKATGAA